MTANVVNTFSSTIISNLNILEIQCLILFATISTTLSKIKATENISKLKSLFKVSDVVKREILHEIINLDASKSFQDTDVPTKIIKENGEVFAIMFKQLGDSMEDCFLKFQYGFTKAYSTQQCPIALIEKWKSATDKGKSFRELLRDLSKAFDCLPHELLIAKLHAYGFSLATLRLVCSYSCLIKNKGQKKKKRNESYSSWEEILFARKKLGDEFFFYLTI